MELDILSDSYFSPPTFHTLQSQPGLPLNGFQIHFLFPSPKAPALVECPTISHSDRLQPPSGFPCPPVLSTCHSAFTPLMVIFLTKNQIIVTFPLSITLALRTDPDASGVSRPIPKLATAFLCGPSPPVSNSRTHPHCASCLTPHSSCHRSCLTAPDPSSHSTSPQHTMSFDALCLCSPGPSVCMERSPRPGKLPFQAPLKCHVLCTVSFDPLLGLWQDGVSDSLLQLPPHSVHASAMGIVTVCFSLNDQS